MPTPKSLLLHIDNTLRAKVRIEVARQLAKKFDAYVVGQPCMLTAMMRYQFALEAAPIAATAMKELDEECLRKARAEFDACAESSPMFRWAPSLAEGPWDFAKRALYSDLVILGQRDEEDPAADQLPPDFLPSVVIACGRPALILPKVGLVESVGDTMVLAWKETPEAARALAAALPWLQCANQVHVVTSGASASTALESLDGYLRDQGIAATLHDSGSDDGDAGNRILSICSDFSADLLVMGCYGHSRVREWVMGGVTRTILQTMTLPVLMAH